MRQVINLSLPPEMDKLVRQAVKKGHYASLSEFFRVLLRKWLKDELYQDVLESEKEFARGQGKKLKSLKELR
ncbi:MAG TPA: ribbon-helix-helix protein, CopG family [Patescibacteria group bacterium]